MLQVGSPPAGGGDARSGNAWLRESGCQAAHQAGDLVAFRCDVVVDDDGIGEAGAVEVAIQRSGPMA